MVLCGVCIAQLQPVRVFLDVVTRTIGYPWLWLQQATTAFFAWGVFIGIAAAIAAQRPYLSAEITKRMTGSEPLGDRDLQPSGCADRGRIHGLVRLQERDAGPGQLPHALAPFPDASIPASCRSRASSLMLFCVEQMVNGWRQRLRGSEDDEFLPEPVE